MKLLITSLFFLISTATFAQTIIGEWETYDEKTNEKKALIEIYESNDKIFAKIKASYTAKADAICELCQGDKKNQPIIGLVIIEDMKLNGDEYKGGSILDPESGKTYKCKLKLESDGRLKVRGFIGMSLLGRTQYWKR